MVDPTASVEVFAAKVLRQLLWPHQIEAAGSDRFITTIAAARRTGKSTMAETLAMWTAMRERNVVVLILSATQESARRMTESIAATLNARPLTKGAVVEDFSTRIRLANGSQIISLPASQRQIRGYGKGVRLVILDEAGFMPEELWAAAHYTALDERPDSRVLLLGTPWGDGFFRRAYNAGLENDPDHASFNWKHTANPDLDHKYLERQRDRVSPAEFAAEVEGKWSAATGSLISRELLESCTADIEVPALSELGGPARGIVGCDWGVSYDRSATVGIYRLPVQTLNPDREPKPVFIALPWVWPQGEQLDRVVGGIVKAAPNFAALCAEVNGVGSMPSQELARRARSSHPSTRFLWNFVSTTAGSKTAGYGCVLSLLERGQLVLPRDPDLLRQLAGLKFQQGERGFMRIEAEDAAVHDDVSDALYLATLPHRPPNAHRVICRLATLAGEGAPPEQRVPDLDCPVVETGGGLRLYQRPTLQGVMRRDPGLSQYAPQKPPEPVGIRAGRFFFNTTQGVTP